MRGFKLQIAGWLRAVVLPAAFALLAAGMFGPTTLAPSSRLSEENVPSRQLSEELTVHGRFDQQRHLRLAQGTLAITTVVSTWLPLGRAQHAVFEAPAGHRLSNGLLAPMTC